MKPEIQRLESLADIQLLDSFDNVNASFRDYSGVVMYSETQGNTLIFLRRSGPKKMREYRISQDQLEVIDEGLHQKDGSELRVRDITPEDIEWKTFKEDLRTRAGMWEVQRRDRLVVERSFGGLY